MKTFTVNMFGKSIDVRTPETIEDAVELFGERETRNLMIGALIKHEDAEKVRFFDELLKSFRN